MSLSSITRKVSHSLDSKQLWLERVQLLKLLLLSPLVWRCRDRVQGGLVVFLFTMVLAKPAKARGLKGFIRKSWLRIIWHQDQTSPASSYSSFFFATNHPLPLTPVNDQVLVNPLPPFSSSLSLPPSWPLQVTMFRLVQLHTEVHLSWSF